MWKYTVNTSKGEYELLAVNVLEAEQQARAKLGKDERLFGIASEDYDAMIDPRDEDFRKGPY